MYQKFNNKPFQRYHAYFGFGTLCVPMNYFKFSGQCTVTPCPRCSSRQKHVKIAVEANPYTIWKQSAIQYVTIKKAIVGKIGE